MKFAEVEWTDFEWSDLESTVAKVERHEYILVRKRWWHRAYEYFPKMKRRRIARELRKRGWSYSAISRATGASPAVVREWISI